MNACLTAIFYDNRGKLVPERLHSGFYNIGAKDDDGGGDNWIYKTRKVPVKSSPPTNRHPAN